MLNESDIEELLKFTKGKNQNYEEAVSVVLILLIFCPLNPTQIIKIVQNKEIGIYKKLKKPYFFNSAGRLSLILNKLMFLSDEEDIKKQNKIEKEGKKYLKEITGREKKFVPYKYSTGLFIYNSSQDRNLFDQKYLKDKRQKYYQIDFTRLPVGELSTSPDFQEEIYGYFKDFNSGNVTIKARNEFIEIIQRVKEFNLITFFLIFKAVCEHIDLKGDIANNIDINRFVLDYIKEKEFKKYFE